MWNEALGNKQLCSGCEKTRREAPTEGSPSKVKQIINEKKRKIKREKCCCSSVTLENHLMEPFNQTRGRTLKTEIDDLPG